MLRERGEVIAGRFYLRKQRRADSCGSSFSSEGGCDAGRMGKACHGLKTFEQQQQQHKANKQQQQQQLSRKEILTQYCFKPSQQQQQQQQQQRQQSVMAWDENDEEMVRKLVERNSLSLLLEGDCHLNFKEDGSFIGLYSGEYCTSTFSYFENIFKVF